MSSFLIELVLVKFQQTGFAPFLRKKISICDVDPQRRCQGGTGGIYHMDQFLTGIFLKLRVANLLPHPQVLDCGIAQHLALNKIAWTGRFLFSGNFRHGDIEIDPHILSTHLFPKRRREKSRNLFGVQLLK